jgi:hypothetical protein
VLTHALLAAEGIEAAALSGVGLPAQVILRRAENYDVVVVGAQQIFAQ